MTMEVVGERRRPNSTNKVPDDHHWNDGVWRSLLVLFSFNLAGRFRRAADVFKAADLGVLLSA